MTVDGTAGRPQALCDLARNTVQVSGAAIMLQAGGAQTSLCSSNPVAREVGDLCQTLGEGPTVDAHRSGIAVLEPDLAIPIEVRWPIFAPLALKAGAAAIFAFPLRVGTVRLGALTLYNADSGRLSYTQCDDALTVAAAILHVCLWDQSKAPPGELAPDVKASTDYRAEIHQASGMISVQMAIGVADALVVLRARAYVDGRPLLDVARDVVHRRLRFDA